MRRSIDSGVCDVSKSDLSSRRKITAVVLPHLKWGGRGGRIAEVILRRSLNRAPAAGGSKWTTSQCIAIGAAVVVMLQGCGEHRPAGNAVAPHLDQKMDLVQHP